MANSELSKLKILFIYDYFRNHVSVSGENSAVSASDLIAYLENKTGNTFERKSIYADINKINEYVYSSGLTDDPEWIYSDAKKRRLSLIPASAKKLRKCSLNISLQDMRKGHFMPVTKRSTAA